ncbi:MULTISPECIES: HNH endonuclease [Bacillus]|uniref:HNH endonuclease n=2 Tax=Bacillaceae TaxID=186817 RepID=UPI0005565DD5|nr:MULTISPECIES: HNH endonuclease signature motif containing protein [Bacillus]MBU4620917.1 HNH endonuclease [Bacillus sp. GG161]
MALKDKPEVRYALWQAHQRRCTICLEDLFNYSDLQVDHIIPEATFKDNKKVKKVINDFKLTLDFDFNGLENLRPAHHKCNNDKRNNDLPEEISSRLLRRAKGKIKEVKKHIKKFEEEAKYALSLEVIRKQLNEGKITTEEYADRLNNHMADFGEADIKNFSTDGKFLKYKNKSVILEGYLPVINENRGSCLFTFNSFYIRGTNISLGHKEILSELYPGNNTPIHFEMRRYIVAKLDENNYIVQLGNSRFNLSYEEVFNLCIVIDKFISAYIEAIIELEEIIDCKDFFPNHYDLSKYHLIKVNMNLWKEILEFSSEHDYEKGSSKWHIFDASGDNMLKVYIKEDDENYNKGHKCIIHSFIDNYYSLAPSNYVWLLWNDMNLSKEYGVKDYWTVKHTYKWLTRELLPKIIRENSTVKSKRIFEKKEKINNIQVGNYYSDGEHRYFSSMYIVNATQLVSLVNEIQLFYSISRYVCTNKTEIINLYRAILASTKANNKLNYHYLCSTLNITPFTNNKVDIENFLINKIDYYNNLIENELGLLKIYSYQLDLLFRVLSSNLKELKIDLELEDIREYLESIDWYINDYNTNKLVKCYK